MKKRNTTIFAFLLLAAVGMGVGYAALTDNLSIGGKVDVNTDQAMKDWNDDVRFTNMEFDSTHTANKAAVASVSYEDEDDTAVLNVTGLDSKGDVIDITFTVGNANTNYNAQIAEVTAMSNDNEANFTITASIIDSVAEKNNGTATIKVSIELLVQPTETLTANFSVSYTATSVNP